MQIDYVIANVEPLAALESVGALKKIGDQWYTKEPVARIVIEFRNTLVTSVIIKNYNADLVNMTLKNDTIERKYHSVIDRNNRDWSKYQDREIEISNNEIYDCLIIEVLNFDQKEYRGLKQLRIFGEQDKTEEPVIKKKYKKREKLIENEEEKKEKKEKKEQKEKKEKKEQFEEKKQQQNQWQQYFKDPQSSERSNFKDARLNLRNLNKSPSPVKQEIIEIPKSNEKIGENINDEDMIRYYLRDIDPQFLSLHTQLQISSDTSKDEQFSIENLQKFWLK